MFSDIFETHAASLTSPPERAFTISPDDGADLGLATRALMVSGSGDVAMVTTGGDTITLPGLVTGVQYAIRVRRVLATGTTATGLVGFA